MIEILLLCSAVILIVMALRLIFRNKVSSRIIYCLWLLVAACLLVIPVVYLLTGELAVGSLGALVWMVGALALSTWFVMTGWLLRKDLRKNATPFSCPESPVPVWISPELTTPCLVGLFRPAVYLTPAAAEDEESCRHVLAHELTHLRHGDHIWSFLRRLCLVIYWFHPLVWLAVQMSRQDSELACDEGALKRLGDEQRMAYGKTVVDVAAASWRKSRPKVTVDKPRKKVKSRVVWGVGVFAGAALMAGLTAWLMNPPMVQQVVLKKIQVEQLPHQKHYACGQKLNSNGLVLQLTYSDGTIKQVTEGFTCAPETLDTLGDQFITVSYEGKTTEFSVSVAEVIKTGKLSTGMAWMLTTDYALIFEGAKITPDSARNGGPWLEYLDQIRSITLPQGLTNIGSYLFTGCKRVKEIWIPDSVKFIGQGAFYQCASLSSCRIPEGITIIGKDTFYQCKALKTVTLPTTLTKIGESAFQGCSLLDNVTLPKGLQELGEYAFRDCTRLSRIVIPGSVKEMNNTFMECTGLKEVVLEEGVKSLGGSPFCDCVSLVSVTIPASLTYLDTWFCSGAKSLQSVSVDPGNRYYASDASGALYTKSGRELILYPAGRQGSYKVASNCKIIRGYAFENATGLTAVTLPGMLEIIREGAFKNCTGLKEVTIPKTVKIIDWFAFKGCTGLETFTALNKDCQMVSAEDAFGLRNQTLVRCYADSRVYTIAVANGYQYEIIS